MQEGASGGENKRKSGWLMTLVGELLQTAESATMSKASTRPAIAFHPSISPLSVDHESIIKDPKLSSSSLCSLSKTL
jgi:hypothetical protein